MTAMQRRKGRAGEQEVATLLRDYLGLKVRRNWQEQAAEGGADLTGIPGWAAEVKLCKKYSREWWVQTVDQAACCGQKPVLFYRITGQGRGLPDMQKWRAVVRARDFSGQDLDEDHTVEMALGTWVQFVRETLGDEQ
jgi:hypothetical protein